MTLPLLITLGVLIGGWSFLTVLGNEGQVQGRDQARPRPAAAGEAEAPVGREVAG